MCIRDRGDTGVSALLCIAGIRRLGHVIALSDLNGIGINILNETILDVYKRQVLVGDGDLAHLIPLVGLCGDGHSVAVACVSGRNGDRTVLGLIHGDGVAVRMTAAIVAPLCRIGSVASAARWDGDGHIILAVKPCAAPAGEGVAGACGILEGKGCLLYTSYPDFP